MDMPQRGERHAVIARLREEIRRMEHRPARRVGSVRSGVAAVDALLPGGFPRGALSELAGGPASGKTAVALAVFAALRPDDLAAYVDGQGELYPPAAAALGVDLERLLLVRTATTSARPEDTRPAGLLATLWAAEALLACGAFAAVAVDAAQPRSVRGGDAIARRLQAAVERGGAVGLWLAPARGGLRVPAPIRLVLSNQGGAIAARRSDPFAAAPAHSRGSGNPEGGAGAA
jgi:protein ImuA